VSDRINPAGTIDELNQLDFNPLDLNPLDSLVQKMALLNKTNRIPSFLSSYQGSTARLPK
jgi:hypothetical protein